MWRREARTSTVRALRLAVAFGSAGLAGGCFQPLYGESTLTGSSSVRDGLSAIAIEPIPAPAGTAEARVAVQLRNDLIFKFTGGGAAGPPVYKLKVAFTGGRQIIAVDKQSALSTAENFAMNATYSLTEIATGKAVVTGRAVATVSYDPSGQQRFARLNAVNDAEQRAASVIAENISTRLASYFISGS